jgi:hypothetical protein
MRAALIAFLLTAALAPSCAEDKAAAPGGDGKAGAEVDWRVVDVKDVPATVKKALIAACDKLVGEEEVKGFTYYQTSLLDTPDTRFKATFRAGDKQHVVTCTPAGEISDTQSTTDQPAPPAK